MGQLDLFGEIPQEIILPKKETPLVKEGEWYSIDGYTNKGLVVQVMTNWVELDAKVSPCYYARIKDLT